jgi:hypothetical protein
MLPLVAERHDLSPIDWAQIWAHEFSDAANRSTNSTSQGRPSLPWAQGVAGSNPVAPTTFPKGFANFLQTLKIERAFHNGAPSFFSLQGAMRIH